MIERDVWDTHNAGSEAEQVEFPRETERNLGAKGDLEGSVVEPGYEDAAICSHPSEQGRRLLKLTVQ
ncbi:hypothetical protein GCM10027038_19330 [Arthrobacter bambusae]